MTSIRAGVIDEPLSAEALSRSLCRDGDGAWLKGHSLRGDVAA